MSAAKIAITLDRELLRLVDDWVAHRRYASRSKAIQEIVREKIIRSRRSRLAEEAKKLNPKHEQGASEEWYAGESWPEY